MFDCLCSKDAITKESVCFWKPKDKLWSTIFYCGPKMRQARKMRRKRLMLKAWWKHPSAGWRWEESVAWQNEFFEGLDAENKKHDQDDDIKQEIGRMVRTDDEEDEEEELVENENETETGYSSVIKNETGSEKSLDSETENQEIIPINYGSVFV